MDDIINFTGYVCKDCPENGKMAGKFISFDDYKRDYEDWTWGGLPGHCNDDGTPLSSEKPEIKVIEPETDLPKEAVKAKSEETKPKKKGNKKK